MMGALTFVMRVQTSEEKTKLRSISEAISLNLSGQGLSMKFIPKFEDNNGKIKFFTFTTINANDKSCTLYVSILDENMKHSTFRYPCKIQDGVIYSVGLEYVKEMTFCLQEYVIMGTVIFLISCLIISAIKIIKS